MLRLSIAPLLLWLAACPGPKHAQPDGAAPLTTPVGRDGKSLRGVAGDGTTVFAALASQASSTLEARRGDSIAWSAVIPGNAGVLALGGGTLYAALVDPQVRGQPGSAVAALDPASGALRWSRAFHATEWATISSLAPIEGGAVAGGSFSGTLRIGDRVVSSAGKADGFVVRLDGSGAPQWLVRVGGPHADAVQGLAVSGSRIAVAGTFASGAELAGVLLPAFDERTPHADGFVAELDANGRRAWAASFGGKRDDAVAGVAIDASGRVVAAGTIRESAHVGGADLVAQGDADGVVAWWSRVGGAQHAVLIGGPDFDGVRGITAVGDRIVVAGFFSGQMRLGDRTLAAGGGDDSFIAALDDHGAVLDGWQIGGAGREEITAIASVPGGFIAGVAHTAEADLAGAALPAPKDPFAGAAIMVRPVR